MAKIKTLQSRSNAAGVPKKPRPSGKKPVPLSQSPTQTNQPYEQAVKRRIGQFAGADEPPLMKK